MDTSEPRTLVFLMLCLGVSRCAQIRVVQTEYICTGMLTQPAHVVTWLRDPIYPSRKRFIWRNRTWMDVQIHLGPLQFTDDRRAGKMTHTPDVPWSLTCDENILVLSCTSWTRMDGEKELGFPKGDSSLVIAKGTRTWLGCGHQLPQSPTTVVLFIISLISLLSLIFVDVVHFNSITSHCLC